MPDLIIKPKNQSGNKLILQDQAGGAVLTTADSGATLGNSTQDNITRLGTVTAGTIGSAVTGFTGIKEVDQWRITSSASISGDGWVPLTANWERCDTSMTKIGTGMTEASGVFTFPSTGIWYVSFQTMCNAAGGYRKVGIGNLELTTNNSAYSAVASSQFNMHDNGARAGCHINAIIDITDLSNMKVRGQVYGDNTITVYGDTGETQTGFTFLRLGDT